MLRVRWLGRVAYRDALALQRGLFTNGSADHLLLLEHDPVYTLGVRGTTEHLLVDPASVGAELVRADSGGDITFHGPGQLVGYPVLSVVGERGGGMADTRAYVAGVAQVLTLALADLGLSDCGFDPDRPGVWVDPLGLAGPPRKIAALGVKLTRGRSMHGFALNVSDEVLPFFAGIVPCGISDRPVTTLAREGVVATMKDVVDAVAARAVERWAHSGSERADVVWRVRPEDLAPFSRGHRTGEPVRPDQRRRAGAASPAPRAGAGQSSTGEPVRITGASGRPARPGRCGRRSVDLEPANPSGCVPRCATPRRCSNCAR